jgi:enoyl-CoA hydratase/carnithine racemase
MPSELHTERRSHTLVLTLSDPATRNTLSPQACTAGVEALETAESSDEIRCVVLRGEGSHFCAGGDLNRLRGTRTRDDGAGPDMQLASIDQFHAFVEALRALPKPVIAAVEGFAAGGGFSLALACDLIVAAEDARFVMSYARIGLSPDGGGSWHLARLLPPSLALQMIWLPEPVGAVQMQQWGLVNRVAPNGEALGEALQLADRLAGMAPNALASAKELVRSAALRPLRAHLDDERDHFVANLFHRNGLEGLQAFLEKRAPRFR